MKTTKYLYDIEPSTLISMNYEEAIRFKLHAAKELISKLVQVDYDLRDDQRVHDVFDAITFNENLLKELQC